MGDASSSKVNIMRLFLLPLFFLSILGGNAQKLSTEKDKFIKQLTKEDGLVQGLEKGVIEREVVRPWFSTEFINCLGFFLMTRKPKYWRNGEASIELLHPYSEEIIESLKEE